MKELLFERYSLGHHEQLCSQHGLAKAPQAKELLGKVPRLPIALGRWPPPNYRGARSYVIRDTPDGEPRCGVLPIGIAAGSQICSKNNDIRVPSFVLSGRATQSNT